MNSTTYPLIPMRNLVLQPGTVLSVTVGRAKSVRLIETLKESDLLVAGVQRDPELRDPDFSDLHPVATLARVIKVAKHPNGAYALVIEGVGRFQIERPVTTEPFWTVEGHALADEGDDTAEAETLASVLREQLEEMASADGGAFAGQLPEDEAPGRLADKVAGALPLDLHQRVTVLMTLNSAERLRLVARLVAEVRAQASLRQAIEAEVREELNKNHKDAILRQQLKAIKNQLGSDEEDTDELRAKLAAITFPEDAAKVVERELSRLDSLEPNQAEYNVVRNYLEWMADLPWDTAAPVKEDLNAIEEQLDADHYGLDDVKQRILEHMAVLKLSGNPKGTILCLAGPPGVGKTSLGQSIAEATGRPFVRIALGGVRDEAEIRGHRRTYIGSRPGRIIHALRKAGANNPVMLLDEVDKLGKGWAGDPEAALLEVLDPEQNSTFQDHYMEVPFDLSQVLFICTANQLENLSAPLRDRLEIIEVSGYTLEEKKHIARNHLVPRQLADHAISPDALTVTDEALARMISGYTREAGVRQLNRNITKLCRAVALEVARSSDPAGVVLSVDEDDVTKYLGKVKFHNEMAARTAAPGVATGLAWTPVGGDILFIETSKMPGTGQLQITGQLGEVMQESARAALTYVRSHAEELRVDPAFLKTHDVHIHVPAGAVPKDGPSAGVTIFTALASLLTDRRVRSDTAMTGECTLRGRVLPVGGIKAKVLAAHRAGIKRIILPAHNMADLDEVPEAALADLEIIPAEDMSQVLAAALEDATGPLVTSTTDTTMSEMSV
ncbi:MAG: endopeptidase La [bacterium]